MARSLQLPLPESQDNRNDGKERKGRTMKQRLTQIDTRQRSWRKITNAVRENLEVGKKCTFDLFDGLFEEKTNRVIPVRVATVSPVIARQQHRSRVSLIPYRSQYLPGRKI